MTRILNAARARRRDRRELAARAALRAAFEVTR